MADIIQFPEQFTDHQIEIMRRTVAKDVPPAEFSVFLEVCKRRQLNPFNREIYAIMRKGSLTIQVSIDGFRLLAERSGKYRGQRAPQYCGKDGQWREEWLSDEPPMAAKVGVLRSDFDEPIWAIARYKSYAQMREGQPTEMWRKMPDVLLAKCAESLAIRKAFPLMVAGLYTHEEMMQADTAPAVRAPSLKALHIKGQDTGLWEDTEAFYGFCTDVLDRSVTRDNGKSVTAEERLRIDVAIDEAIANLHPVVVEAEQDEYVSVDEISRELAEKQPA